MRDISFAFAYEDYDFHPTTYFGGVVSIDATQIYKGTNTKDLKSFGFMTDPINGRNIKKG